MVQQNLYIISTVPSNDNNISLFFILQYMYFFHEDNKALRCKREKNKRRTKQKLTEQTRKLQKHTHTHTKQTTSYEKLSRNIIKASQTAVTISYIVKNYPKLVKSPYYNSKSA